MRIRNVHERRLPVPALALGPLVDGLGEDDDRLWPQDRWPAMRFDRALQLGAVGGHGPVRYSVSEYAPGNRVVFEFDPGRGLTRGFTGHHSFEVEEQGRISVLRHVLEADCTPRAWLRWVILIRPLHNALLEDALDRAESSMGTVPEVPATWSFWVRLLRRIAGRRKR